MDVFPLSGESYSSLAGFFKQYELVYVVADGRDVIRVRTTYRRPQEDVYVYRVRTRFWDSVSDVPLDQADLDPEMRHLFRDTMFLEPLPPLERVIFLCTPHRGSFRATGWMLGFVRRLVRFPGAVVRQFRDLLKQREFAQLNMSALPASVDNMNPIHPFIRNLNATPIDSRIHAHSIFAALGSGPLTGRTDGIVSYESAHLEGVESELVVQSGHSAQGERRGHRGDATHPARARRRAVRYPVVGRIVTPPTGCCGAK